VNKKQCDMFLIYSPDGTNVYGAKGGEFEDAGWV